MALVERQVTEKIVSRGLGGSDSVLKSEEGGTLFTLSLNVKVTVWQDELCYPTTGAFFREDKIDGWYWDRTFAQGYSAIPTHEIKTSIGGAKYLESEGIPESYYRGYVIAGCELLDIRKRENAWLPVIKTGSYSANGNDKPLYSSNSICIRAEQGTMPLFFSGNKDNITVAIYSRDDQFVKSIYREYKEDNAVYKYSWQNNDSVVLSNRTLSVGSFNVIDSDALEFLGIYSGSEQSLYTKYFPLQYINVFVGNNLVALSEGDGFTVDKDLGIVTLLDNLDAGEVYCRYVAVPRVDIEVDPSVGFRGRCDLKPHSSKQANGVIEISSEDKHVAKIKLEVLEPATSLAYSSGFKNLKAICLDSKGNPVDEVEVSLQNLSNLKDIKFEGNLEEQKLITNSDGEVKTIIAAPLNSAASSFFFDRYDSGFILDPKLVSEVNRNVQDEALLFEILKVDPFHGSDGITLEILWDEAEGAHRIVEEGNFTNNDYKIFRNLINNKLVEGKNSEAACYELFYNSGFITYSKGIVPILKINKTHIWLAGYNQALTDVKIFKKNENNKGLGFERLVYEVNSEGTLNPVKARRYSAGKLEYAHLQNRNSNIVSGYRVVVPRREELQARCTDPATGIEIVSNTVSVNLELPSVYKEEIALNSTRIGVKSYLTVDSTGNTLEIGGQNEQ